MFVRRVRIAETSRFGRLVVVDTGGLVDDAEVLAFLHPDEVSFAEQFSEVRRATFLGGRLAARIALSHFSVNLGAPILPTERGAPSIGALEAEFSVSLSHKTDIAGALAVRRPHREVAVGVDLEPARVPRRDLSRHVLCEEEMAADAALPADERGMRLLRRFCVKEAIYKAIDPVLGRYVPFKEASVSLSDCGIPMSAALRGRPGEPAFGIDLEFHQTPDWLIAKVSAWPLREGSICSVERVSRQED